MEKHIYRMSYDNRKMADFLALLLTSDYHESEYIVLKAEKLITVNYVDPTNYDYSRVIMTMTQSGYWDGYKWDISVDCSNINGYKKLCEWGLIKKTKDVSCIGLIDGQDQCDGLFAMFSESPCLFAVFKRLSRAKHIGEKLPIGYKFNSTGLIANNSLVLKLEDVLTDDDIIQRLHTCAKDVSESTGVPAELFDDIIPYIVTQTRGILSMLGDFDRNSDIRQLLISKLAKEMYAQVR
jgi:hypothetical protein